MRASLGDLVSLAVLMAASAMTAGASGATQAPFARNVHEITLTATREYANPFQDVDVRLEVTSPSGRRTRVDGFWDGGRSWRARVAATEHGEWRWASVASSGDPGLTRQGRFDHDGPLAPGPLRVAQGGSWLEDSAGQPFFWLADTAWNGALRATPADWREYLATRDAQQFNVIQFVTTQWRGGRDVVKPHAFSGTANITIDPAFFQRMDARLGAVVEHGLVPAPVVLWALGADDPGQALPEADAIRLSRYELARWGALHPVWLLGGDGHFTGENAARWHRIGQAVFGDHPEQLVTLHPSGQSWVAADHASQAWYDFIGYQSGHGDSDANLRWLTSGPPAQGWTAFPGRPILNLEPNYEGHPSYQSRQPHPALHVRRAAWWSTLVAPPAGVTYGNNEIWVWNDAPGPAENHPNIGSVRSWREGLRQEGLEDMTVLRQFFESGRWWALRPAQQVLARQPGEATPAHFAAVAQTADEQWTVVYLPAGQSIELTVPGGTAEWVDPRTGERRPAGRTGVGLFAFAPPDSRDWVLSVQR